ncbi:MAG: bifunctional 3-phosphoshikimate 1-carboxyvinyltransferase/cytidylate kinase [Brachymonas sp.]|nr:bifunctional 3-phosphoshikimate 1-carboxyvinyltransferase/cytidylate kinase [Brachymonas sp.]
MYSTAFLDLPPLASASGTVQLPGSKSISNRVLLLAALSSGRTLIHDLLDSDDTRVMLTALEQLGCGVERGVGGVVTDVAITGLGGKAPLAFAKLFLGNAGTAMRPLTAALAVLGGDFTLSGVPRMHERPIGDLVDALRQLGCQIDYTGNDGFPPLKIGQPQLKLNAPIAVRGDVSSQFLTALLLALPLVAKQDVHIDVIGELISKPYIEITLNLLQKFGIAVRREDWKRFTIPAGSRYQSPGEIWVEADASSASYFIALGALSMPVDSQKGLKNQPAIRIEGLSENAIQGDIRFIEAARQMGALITSGANHLEISQGAWPLKAIDLDCNHIPDAAMTLAVMALYADGTTTLRNIASWRVKETDRIAAMATELRKLGATVVEGQDFIQITPPARGAKSSDWKAASIHTYDDHRVAMCFSLAAFNPAGVVVRIEDPKCVAKTFPDYFETLFSVVTPKSVPVICVDGPTASGKGTLASRVAEQLGFHYLDSGSLYRLTALAAERSGVDWSDEQALTQLAKKLPVEFEGGAVLLGGDDVSEDIRTEHIGMGASKISVFSSVRSALTDLQRSFAKLPGLVADGRDMGTVIFPGSPLKIYLTANSSTRAERRYKQLISKGISAKLDLLRADLEARDLRDSSRASAPLKAAEDAVLLDNSNQTIEQSVDFVLSQWRSKLGL